MLQGGTSTSEMQATTLPELPSREVGHLLLETVYLYIQARYCIVDWVQLREWHQRRDTICYSTKDDDLDTQTGAYFIWIIYAIGAGFVSNPEYPPRAYFARALKYLHPILTLQNSTTVQALLCLCQYHFRTTTPVNVDIDCTDSDKIKDLQFRQRAGEDGSQIGGLTSISSALHHLEFYRLKSRIMTRLFGPHALPPTYEDVQRLLSELDNWRATAPQNIPKNLPRQSDTRKQGFYLQAVLLTMRPVLLQQSVDEHLLLLCAEKAADACEIGRLLSISPETHPSLTDLYQNFYCGITLLQCLALQSTILPARRIARAIVACSSTLSVCTRQFPVGAPFLEIFEKLSDRFLGPHDELTSHEPSSMLHLRTLLEEIMSNDPSQVSRILNSLSPDAQTLYETIPVEGISTESHFPMTGEFFSAMGISDVAMPFDMPFDMLSMNGSQPDMTDLWGVS
ncbi:hypothetical protein, variant [Exophiala oligosperma]|uniref:Transcription factor domain-containing protein n=1 Tax=Exophiala oligosperma TaxID=215243 RepID=A0A0D2B5Y2_9EURO|nr:uncharacterized protein PV06_00351 [Exophiala oligosperma]XP_016267898.1 hypothetical protein, variant [Exophiala oligosperma]KIW47681.1 hypothetical protein PV06_00351 [Exophiala oligosperma]KIW47682.1 hypothetical protein, variant [Exophiala oligosperma]